MRGDNAYAERSGISLTLTVKKNPKFVRVEDLTAVLLKRLVFL
jgi:hypothetical protein